MGFLKRFLSSKRNLFHVLWFLTFVGVSIYAEAYGVSVFLVCVLLLFVIGNKITEK